jgi:hypothetical protein
MPTPIATTLRGHTSIRLDSGEFLFLPSITDTEPQEFREEDGSIDRVTIKGFSRHRPLEATVHGRTLQVTLPIADFRKLRVRFDARSPDARNEVTFNVDDVGNVSELLLNGEPLSRYYPRRSEVNELSPGAAPEPKKKAKS